MEHDRPIAASTHVEIYRILDDALGQPVPSPGWRGSIHAVIDDLRRCRDSAELVRLAETISLNLHQLEWARKNGNRDTEKEARHGLADAAAAWLNFRILH
jgi:hypothetical protein